MLRRGFPRADPDPDEGRIIRIQLLDRVVHPRRAGHRVDRTGGEHHHEAIAGVLHDLAVRRRDRGAQHREEVPAELVGRLVTQAALTLGRANQVAEQHRYRGRTPRLAARDSCHCCKSCPQPQPWAGGEPCRLGGAWLRCLPWCAPNRPCQLRRWRGDA